MKLNRRVFLTRSIATSLAVSTGLTYWKQVFAATATIGKSLYGPLGTPDASGIQLPQGFTFRLIGMTGQVVPGTNYISRSNAVCVACL